MNKFHSPADPLGDGISQIQFINFMGDDQDVVGDARASFVKLCDSVGDREVRLIHRLIKGIDEPQHTSPLRGTVLKFRVKAPLFVARQWYKHHVASCHSEEQDGWNEQSFRYVEAQPEFYIPGEFRSQSASNKQAAAEPLSEVMQHKASAIYNNALLTQYNAYQDLIAIGVCREQARGILPACTYTTWVWTASLQTLLNFIDLREGHGAQTEIAAYVPYIQEGVKAIVPATYTEWERRKDVIRKAMQLYREHYGEW